MAIIPTDQLTKPDTVSVLLIGPPKTGKTRSIATLHQYLVAKKLPTKIVFFDMDNDGAETLLRVARSENWLGDIELHRFDNKARRIKDSVAPGRNSDTSHAFINEFNNLFDRVDYKTGFWTQGQEIGAVVIDPLTALQDQFEDFVFATRNKEIGENGSNAITFNEWRLLAEKVMETYQCAKSLPCFFVAMCHVETKQEVIKGTQGKDDIATHKTYDVPLLTGVLRDRIAKDFGVVLYTSAENGNYEWITRQTDRIRSAGSRGRDNLPPRVKQDFSLVLE